MLRFQVKKHWMPDPLGYGIAFDRGLPSIRLMIPDRQAHKRPILYVVTGPTADRKSVV